MTQSATQDISLNVSGMKCGGCENNVKGKLNAINGVVDVDALHKENVVKIEYDDSKTNLDEIKQTITDAGFTIEE